MLVIAWDPGIARSGYAVYDPELRKPGVTWADQYGPALVVHGQVTTATQAPLEQRLLRIRREAMRVRRRFLGRGPLVVHWLVEQPADAVVYAKHKRRGKTATILAPSMQLQHYAAAVLLVSGMWSDRAALVPAVRMDKKLKLRIGGDIIRAAGGPRRLAADVRDAAFLGAAWIDRAL